MDKPLALKLAPKSLKDVYGQSHLIGDNKIISNMVKNKKIFSMILYGKPGIGKTSIANAIVNELGFRLLMSVHDENIGECPIENVKRVTELLSQVMIESNDRCSVPMKCDAEISACWYGESIYV